MIHSFPFQVHELPPEKLRMREVEYIDIGNDPFPPKVNKYSICCYFITFYFTFKGWIIFDTCNVVITAF